MSTNSVKSKFAGLLRGLFGRADDHEATPPPATTRPVTTAAPAAGGAAHIAGSPLSSRPASADEISLPLAAIVAGLPMELRAKMMSVPSPGMTIKVPVETIVSQLAFGTVKITFGELRHLAAGLFAHAGSEHDIKMVSLPLHEILPRLNPSLLARHTRPKVEVDAEIKGPFNGDGKGVSFTTQPLKAPAPAPLPPKKEMDFSPATARMNPPLPISPLTAPSGPIAFAPVPPPSRPPLSPAPTNGNGHHPPPVPTIRFSAAPAPAPVPVAPRPETAQPMIHASLWDLAENWPGELKNEILATSLANQSVPLAGALVEAGLKRGRVTMTWKQIRTLAKPSSSPSANDSLELDLPLKVIAPLFLAAQKNVQRPARKPAVSNDIPNLFFGFPQSAAEMPAPAKPAEKPAEKPVEKKHSESNFYVWGDDNEIPKFEENVFAPPPVPQTDFTSRQTTPKEMVARAMAQPGVAGVVVALPDGLRVASEVAADLNADTLAAFVPQIFERMNQSAKELRMGPLGNVSFTVGNVPWRIYRVNAVYVAAFGRPGESLPAAQLASLACELDRKK
jgi:predicted regulator of Ras-like GTPase activity (Roadblock/LC7/MglB family)